jgi:hypothetical protein
MILFFAGACVTLVLKPEVGAVDTRRGNFLEFMEPMRDKIVEGGAENAPSSVMRGG